MKPRKTKETYEKRRALLKNWTIEYREPSWHGNGLDYYLSGNVYGHPSFGANEHIVTSPLLRIDIPGHTAETINTVYLLG